MDYMVTNSVPLAASTKTEFSFLPVLTGLFTATLLISYVLNCKVIRVGPLPSQAADHVSFSSAFWRCTNGGLRLCRVAKAHMDRPRLAGPVRGHDSKSAPRCRLILAGPTRGAYDVILGAVPLIVAASLTTYFVREFSNSFVLAKCKIRTHGSFMFLRFVLSTMVGQCIDSAAFVLLAFAGRIPPRQIALVAFTGWAIMVLWEVAALPLTLPLVRALKRHAGVHYFDIGTNFNPLHF
jgi:hypothetical protein